MENIDLTHLERINELVSENGFFRRKTKTVKTNKNNKEYTYQYYNQICTCVLRIRETIDYLKAFVFKRDNKFRQAFDFYEYINCVSIVFGCAEELFKIFDMSLEGSYDGKAFVKSNPDLKKTSDIKFFKFLRSASSVHPANTNRHKNITKHKFEVYPYALWCKDNPFNCLTGVPKWADIELLSWNSKTNGLYKRYYVSIREIDLFVTNCLNALKKVVYKMEELLASHKESVRCKRLKNERSFDEYGDYLLYLRKRVIANQLRDEPADGGLLLASFIIRNGIIKDTFKKYIKGRVALLVLQMQRDVEDISYDDLFDELRLYDVIKVCNQAEYISEKFDTYLHYEAMREIEENDFIDFRKENGSSSDRWWSVFKLLQVKDRLYPNNEFQKALSYADLYAITLQRIFEMNEGRAKRF